MSTRFLLPVIGLALCIGCTDPAATHTVTYEGNGNTGGTCPLDSHAYKPGEAVTVATNDGSLTKSGFSFTGWNTAKDGTGIAQAEGSTFNMGNAEVTLYAQWAAVTHTITFVSTDPGSTGTMAPQAMAEGASAALAANTLGKGSYRFMGWATTPGGAVTFADGGVFTMGSSDVTLYATWALKFTVVHMTQGDAAWSADYMGISSVTIVDSGTLLTALAMLLSTEVTTVTPKTLNQYLTNNSGYLSDTAAINYSVVDGYPGTTYAWDVTKSFTLADLKAELDLGNPVVFGFATGVKYGIALSYVNNGTAYGDYRYYNTADSTAVVHVLASTDNPFNIVCYHR
jgi:uncharacterized repeat protein (TIGR02543 family)